MYYVSESMNPTTHKAHEPYKDSGVKEYSPFFWFPLLHIIWDLCIDGMHTIPGWLKDHFLPVLRGVRYPAQPKARKLRDKDHPKGAWTKQDNKRLKKMHKEVCKQLDLWKLPKVLYMCGLHAPLPKNTYP